jgi:hypothetical protein
MKKTSRKLVLRSQTLRVLHDVDLTRAVGGLDSGDASCPTGHAADSGAAACTTTIGAAAIVACR